MKDLLKFLGISLLILFIAGCATAERQSSSGLEEEGFPGTTLAVTSQLRFEDVPVPVGFRLDEKKSFVFQTEQNRVALLKYTGQAKLQDVVEFYKEQMLLYDWKLLNIVEYGKSMLNFERGGQNCIVTIESRGMKKIITISLSPQAKGSIEPPAQKK